VIGPQERPDPETTSEHRSWRGLAAAFIITAAIALVGVLLLLLAIVGRSTGSTAATGGTTTITTTVPAVLTSVASGLTDVSDIAASAVGSVVRIEMTASFRGRQQVVASGSGVIVDQGGTIVTNAHVVDSGNGITVTLDDGSTYSGSVVVVDTAADLAAITIDATGLSVVQFGSSEQMLVGDPVIAIGYPLGLQGGPSVSTGIVSAKNRTIDDSTASLTGILQTDAAITEGSSGGALLDGRGRLVGITTAVGVSRVGIEGIGFAIPVETVEQLLSSLTAKG
jgi:serine protease Do